MATQITTVAGFTSGDDTISTDLLQDFLIDGLAGDDNITLEEAASNLTLKAAGGDDLIVADSDISATSLLKGGASDDTFQFAGAISGSSVYGGKGADSIYFARTVTDSFVGGDTGADRFTFDGKVTGATISGGNGDDSFDVNERLTSTTLMGGESRDSVDIDENSADSKVALGTDNDILRITGKHSNLVVKGGSGDDSFDVEASFTGSGNKFYGGKGEDSIELNTVADVAVYGDKDEDTILFQAVATTGASAYGGSGADTINASALPAASSAVIKGGADNDSILASDTAGVATILQTIYGGKGNDTIIQDTASQQKNYFYGGKGDDVIEHDSTSQGLVSGGDGADSIKVDLASTDTDKPHTVTGGAGVDTLDVEGVQTADHGYGTSTTLRYLPDDATTTLTYGSFAEFFANGDIVDDINIESDQRAVIAEVAEALTFTDADNFDRASYNSAARTETREGLIITTASSVTAGSSITFDADAANYVFGIDVSAGTTGNTSIDVSAETATALGMLLKGGSGRNTIKGTAGLDVIHGGKNDVLLGNAAADIIFANDGKDSIEGGAGNDSIDFATNLTFQDTVKGGDDTDVLLYKAASATVVTDLDNVSGIEKIVLGNAATKITLQNSVVASGASLVIDGSGLTTSTSKLTFDGALELDGATSIVGGDFDDTLKATAGSDTIAGGTGNDSIDLEAGAIDIINYSESGSTNVDTVLDFVSGTDLIGYSIGNIDNGGSNITLSTIGGTDVNAAIAADGFTAATVARNANATAAADGVNLVIATDTSQNTWTTALGTGTFTNNNMNANLGATEAVAAAFYDAGDTEAVYGVLLGGAGASFDKDDTFVEIARISMAANDFTSANIDASLFAF